MSNENRKPIPAKQLREEVRDVLQALGSPEPHIQQAYYSAGVDPCGAPSHFFDLIKQCHERRVDGRPRVEDWERLWDYYSSKPELWGGFVDFDTRFAASENLMPYIFPKKKSVEVSGELEHLVKVVPLTDEDCDRLYRRLKDEY